MRPVDVVRMVRGRVASAAAAANDPLADVAPTPPAARAAALDVLPATELPDLLEQLEEAFTVCDLLVGRVVQLDNAYRLARVHVHAAQAEFVETREKREKA